MTEIDNGHGEVTNNGKWEPCHNCGGSGIVQVETANRQYEYAFQVEGDSPASRDLDGPHFADDWHTVVAEAVKAKRWYAGFGRRITSIRYKEPGEDQVKEFLL